MYLLWLLPKNVLSRLVGRLAVLKLPLFLREPILKAFGRFFGVDFTEIRKPLCEFESVQDFFIRQLKPGLRPIDSSHFVSPCDGVLGQCGPIQEGQLIQAKGKNYTLADLIGEEAPEWNQGCFTTIYLSPKEYHRFHSPCDTDVTRARYIPGYLWPVNAWAVNNIDSLFCVNERIVLWLGQEAILVAVGATCVGKVKLAFDKDLTTNIRNSNAVLKYYDPAPVLKKGEELGYFEFGSTLVLLTKVSLEFGVLGSPVSLGERLGTRAGSRLGR